MYAHVTFRAVIDAFHNVVFPRKERGQKWHGLSLVNTPCAVCRKVETTICVFERLVVIGQQNAVSRVIGSSSIFGVGRIGISNVCVIVSLVAPDAAHFILAVQFAAVVGFAYRGIICPRDAAHFVIARFLRRQGAAVVRIGDTSHVAAVVAHDAAQEAVFGAHRRNIFEGSAIINIGDNSVVVVPYNTAEEEYRNIFVGIRLQRAGVVGVFDGTTIVCPHDATKIIYTILCSRIVYITGVADVADSACI